MCDMPIPFGTEFDPTAPGPFEQNGSSNYRGRSAYSNCDCFRRNGLQDSCPRPGCQHGQNGANNGFGNQRNFGSGDASFSYDYNPASMGVQSSPGFESFQNAPGQQQGSFGGFDGQSSNNYIFPMNQMNPMSQMSSMSPMNGLTRLNGLGQLNGLGSPMNGLSQMSSMNGFQGFQNDMPQPAQMDGSNYMPSQLSWGGGNMQGNYSG